MSRKRLGNNPLNWIRSTVDEAEETATAPASATATLAPPVEEAAPVEAVEAAPQRKERPEYLKVAEKGEDTPVIVGSVAPLVVEETPVTEVPSADMVQHNLAQELSALAEAFATPSDEALPKYLQFEEKISVLFRADQVEFLSQIERYIMRNRTSDNKRERITKNSLVRAMVDFFQDRLFDFREIPDEHVLRERLKASFPKHQG